MPHMTPDNTFVVICDWHGRLVWSSDPELQEEVGDYVWGFIADQDMGRAKEAFAKTATLRETQVLEISNSEDDQHYRVWLWSLDAPEAAVCILCMRVPKELAILTEREKDCLRLLAQGMPTKLIAAELDVSLSTVHTHLKRMREKLNLPGAEALISFASRYCHPMLGPGESGSSE